MNELTLAILFAYIAIDLIGCEGGEDGSCLFCRYRRRRLAKLRKLEGKKDGR